MTSRASGGEQHQVSALGPPPDQAPQPAARRCVLYAEGSRSDAELAAAHFAEHTPDLALELVGTGRGCLARLDEAAFDVVLLDQHLPDMDGIELLRRMVHAGVSVPVVLITGGGDDNPVVKALKLGAATYVPKIGAYVETLPAVIRSVLAEHRLQQILGLAPRPAPRRILYVEHLPMDAELTVEHFRLAAPHLAVEVVGTCRAALERLAASPSYDLALIDLRMPDMSGLDFVRTAMSRGLTVPPFIMISGKGDDATAIATLKLGAVDYIAKREGYLEQLVSCIDRTISGDLLRRLHLQVRAELAERERAEAALRKSEQWHRTLFEGSRDALMTLAPPSWRLTAGNAAALAMFGVRDAEDFVTRNLAELSPERQPDDRDSANALAELLEAALATGQSTFEWIHQRRSGACFPARVQLTRMEVDGAAVLQATVRDETELKALQASLAQADHMASLGLLAAGMAHEINNPLTAVIANVELALQQLTTAAALTPADRDDLHAMLLDAREASCQVRHIVRDLKIFSRHENAEEGAVDVRRVLESSLRLAATEIRHRAQVETDFSEVPLARGSESRLGQVCLNLLINAAQAMPEGDAQANRLRVVTRRANGLIAIEVSDTGVGIAPGAMAQLFTPFFTTKAVGGGTGLGLAVSHRIVTGLGGEIQVDSVLGRGTTFRVMLQPATAMDGEGARPAPAATPAAQRSRILVIDDDPTVLAVLRRVLELDHEVVTASSAAPALERLLAGEDVDLILCDLMMPQMTGMEFFAALRARRPEAARWVVFMTGGAFGGAAQRFLHEVDNPRIEKPFDVDGLRALVAQALASRLAR